MQTGLVCLGKLQGFARYPAAKVSRYSRPTSIAQKSCDPSHRLHTSASIGIALDTASGGDLLRAADTAMYRAKGRYEVFKEAMHDQALERLRLENNLRGCSNGEN